VRAEYEELDKAGKGALLRRERLYTSLISAWRIQRDQGALAALAIPAGRPQADPRDRENTKVRKENERLAAELDRARKVTRDPGKTLRAVGATRDRRPKQRERANTMIDAAITELQPLLGTRAACAATGRPQASHYRRHRMSPAPPRPARERRPQPASAHPGRTHPGAGGTQQPRAR
jgi:hypothetical protein